MITRPLSPYSGNRTINNNGYMEKSLELAEEGHQAEITDR